MTAAQQQARQFLESQPDYIPATECAWGTAMTQRGCALWRGKHRDRLEDEQHTTKVVACRECKHRQKNAPITTVERRKGDPGDYVKLTLSTERYYY